MIDQIQTLYAEIYKKTDFIREAAKDLDKAPTTLRNHWFGAFWQIPEEHQARVVELLKKKINSQKITA